MPCINGGSHDFKNEVIDGILRAVCAQCGHISPYLPRQSYEDLVNQVNLLRKTLEDICECQGNLDELIDKARIILKEM